MKLSLAAALALAASIPSVVSAQAVDSAPSAGSVDTPAGAVAIPLYGVAWHAAKRPVELHVYQTASHGFGMGKPGTTTTMMMDEFLAWLDMQGLLTAKAHP